MLAWLGIVAAVVAIVVFRVRAGTVLYASLFVALPFFMMGMQGGGHVGHAGGSACGAGHDDSPGQSTPKE